MWRVNEIANSGECIFFQMGVYINQLLDLLQRKPVIYVDDNFIKN